MTRILLFMIMILPTVSFAAGGSIDTYVPPPMFGTKAVSVAEQGYPPLPPKRPAKLSVSRSYIEYLRKHGKAPQLVTRRAAPVARDIAAENLIQPSAQDIFDQINPQ